MTDTQREVRLAVETFIARELPDSRSKTCDLAVESVDGSVRVTGTVSTEGLANRLFDRLREFPTVNRDASSVSVLTEMESRATVSVVSAPVMSDPALHAEQVTEVLYGDEITVYDAEGEWRRVAAPDGYLGWVAETSIVPPDLMTTEAVVRADVDQDVVTGADSEGDRLPEYFPIGTPCHIRGETDEAVRVQFRTGATADVPAAALSRPEALPTGEQVVNVARQFAGTEYEWGGMTTDGIDCSGLVWVSYRVFGVGLPRDADQQQLVGEAVSREALHPGDLLFFPGHVAISLGGDRYIHAHGDSGGVVKSSLDPNDEEYIENLDEGLKCCRRLLPA